MEFPQLSAAKAAEGLTPGVTAARVQDVLREETDTQSSEPERRPRLSRH